jgi:hypothetical protein
MCAYLNDHVCILELSCVQATTESMAETAHAAADKAAVELSAALERCVALEGENESLHDKLLQMLQLQVCACVCTCVRACVCVCVCVCVCEKAC